MGRCAGEIMEMFVDTMKRLINARMAPAEPGEVSVQQGPFGLGGVVHVLWMC